VSGCSTYRGKRVGGVALSLAALLIAACTPARGAAPAPAQAPAAPAQPGNAAQAAAPMQPPPRVQMKTAYTTATASSGPLWVAVEAGVFSEHGIDIEISFIGAGQAILGALSSQEAPIVVAGANQAIEANLQGGDYVILGAAGNYLTNAIYVEPSIQRPEDLRGKTLGVSNFGAISHVALKVALEHWGLEEGRDVTVIRSGGTPETLASMQSGAIHGGSFSPPQTFVARDLGFRELIDVASLRYELGTASVLSTRPYTAQNPDVVERYFKALIKGGHLFKTNKDLALETIMRYARTDDRAVAEETWNYFRDKVNDDMTMSSRAVENNLRIVAAENPLALQAKPEQFLDSSFAQRVKASGYLEQVRRGQ
jgi:NitT/TauT family transport system substrate-binding protein